MASVSDLKQEFWGDLQADLFVQNTAVYLADQSLERVIAEDGEKAHRPIVSHPDIGTYTAHSDIDFDQKDASKQTLTVDQFEYAAEDIDITEQVQTKEDLVAHSLKSIRKGLNNSVEQAYLDEITNAHHEYSGSPVSVSASDVLKFFEEAEAKLGSYDAPYETSARAAVLGPSTVATLRRTKSELATDLGDKTMENGVVGPWQGWTVVQNNNLPFSAELDLATNPSDGDTVSIAGVTFTFKTDPSSEGDVDIGTDADGSRANLVDAINGDSGSYTDIDNRDNFMLRRKRRVSAENDSSNNEVDIEGYGDISTSTDLTNGDDGWTNEVQDAVFMIRGAIDLVLQFMRLEIGDKEKGFADLPKGVIGLGTKTFKDGEIMMVRLGVDASDF